MNTKPTHPLIIGAAVAIIIASAVAVASMTGLLPPSSAQNAEEIQAEKLLEESKEPEKEKEKTITRKHVAIVPKSTSSNTASKPVEVEAAVVCKSCGRVSEIREKRVEGEGSGIGAVAGGVTGAVVGKQLGNGNGQKAMAVIGALGGALLGNKIEKDHRSVSQYDVVVTFDDGTSGVYHFQNQPNWQNGDRVKVLNGQITSDF